MYTSKAIDAAIAKRPGIVEEYYSEEQDRRIQWWVHFKLGWTYDNHGQHMYSGTASEVSRYIRGAIQCQCEECKRMRAAN